MALGASDSATEEKRRKWFRPTPMTLTYYTFPAKNTVKNVSSEEINSAFKSAFARWSEVIPVNFEEVNDSSKADIKIEFNCNDRYPFNRRASDMLAYANYPSRNRKFTNIYMKAENIWAVDWNKEEGSSKAYDLESVAIHEIGHVLGLEHSWNPGSVMSSSIPPATRQLNLSIGDAKRAQKIYGARPGFDLNVYKERRFIHLLEKVHSRVVLLSGRVFDFNYRVALVSPARD